MIRVDLLVLVAMLTAMPALAAPVSVVGAGRARECFDAAVQNRPLRASLRICDAALRDDTLAIGDRAATLVNRGIVRMQAGRLDTALADFEAAITLRPETAEAYVNKGIALLRSGNRDKEAVASLSEGIARNPARPEIAYYQRAVANEGLGRVREAYEDYSRAAALAPEWADPAEQLQRFQSVRRKTLTG